MTGPQPAEADVPNPLLNLRPLPRQPSKDFLLLLLLGVLLLSAGLGLRGPWPAEEPRLTLNAVQMLDHGEWLVPRRGEQVDMEVYPGTLWAKAIAIAVTDSVRVGFLLPSLLASILSLLLVYDIGKKLWNPTVGLCAGLTLLLTLQFVLQARTAQPVTLALLCVVLGLRGQLRAICRGPAWPAYLLGSLALGVGLLIQPWVWLAWLMLPLAIVLRRLGWRQLEGLRWHPLWLLGPLLGALPLWIWSQALLASSIPEAAAYRESVLLVLRDSFLLRGEDTGRHIGYYLIAVIPLLWLPMILSMPWALPAWRRRLARHDGRFGLLLGWVSLCLLILSLHPDRTAVHALYVVPGMALALGPLVPGLVELRRVQTVAWLLTLLLAAVVTAIGILGRFGSDAIPEALTSLSGIKPWNFLVAIGLLGLGCVGVFHAGRGLASMASFFCLSWWLYGAFAYPILDPQRSGGMLMEEVERQLSPGASLGILVARPQMILEAERPLQVFSYSGQASESSDRHAARWLQVSAKHRLLVPAEALRQCFDSRGLQPIGRLSRQDWYLVSAQQVHAICLQDAIESSAAGHD